MYQSKCLQAWWKKVGPTTFYIILKHTSNDHDNLGRETQVIFNQPVEIKLLNCVQDYKVKDNVVFIKQNNYQNRYGDNTGSFTISVRSADPATLTIENIISSDAGYEIW